MRITQHEENRGEGTEGRRGGEGGVGSKGKIQCGRERDKGKEKRVRQWTLSDLHFLSLSS